MLGVFEAMRVAGVKGDAVTMVSGRQIQSCHVESSDQEVGKKDTLKDLTSGADVLGLCIIEARANKAQAKNGLKEVVELT